MGKRYSREDIKKAAKTVQQAWLSGLEQTLSPEESALPSGMQERITQAVTEQAASAGKTKSAKKIRFRRPVRRAAVAVLAVCLLAALWLGRVLFHALSTATSHRATFAVLGEIRKRCMEKLTRMPLGTVLEQSSGVLMNTLIERIDSIETTLAHIVPEFTANLLIPVLLTISSASSGSVY